MSVANLGHLPTEQLHDLLRMAANEGGIPALDYAEDGRPVWSTKVLATVFGMTPAQIDQAMDDGLAHLVDVAWTGLVITHLQRREPEHNRLRFYAIAVTQTLFDRWAVIREWGRIGQPGTVRESWFETEAAAIEAGEQVRQRKQRRGYRAVGG